MRYDSWKQVFMEQRAPFQEFPLRQKAASFTVDQVMEKLQAGITSR